MFKKITVTSNFQVVFESSLFRRTFNKRNFTVTVYHDHDGNRLVKCLDGKPIATLNLPRNWTDKERNDGRKWYVGAITPSNGYHLTPKVEVTFQDRIKGKTLNKTF